MRLNFFRHRPSRRTTIFIVIGAVLALTVGHTVYAQSNPVGNALGNAIFLILSTIVWALTKLLATLTGLFISLLVAVARYNVFLNAPVVKIGWPIVRDLMNMMFIIALLIISAGTVLRLQNYRYNRLLGKLILMALLVNFSKFIAVFLLQFAQVVMLTFVNAIRDIAAGNFSHMLGLDSVLNFTAQNDLTNLGKSNGGFSVFVSLVAGMAMMLVAFVVMLAITVMLFIRIIALWFLIILSPIAYALRVLPNTEKYASEWWGEFTKYAVMGPVLAFFLWISLALVNSSTIACQDKNTIADTTNPLSCADQNVHESLVKTGQDNAALTGDLLTKLLSIDQLVTYTVGIIFLMLGLQYAQKSSNAGSGFVKKVAQTGFGVASTVSGLNAIRDRTIAPVQGWIKNRGRARDSAVQQRTETLENAGDRTRAAFGGTRLGQGLSRAPVIGGGFQRGTDKAQAAANAYERNRNARAGQEVAVKDWTDDRVRDTFLNQNGSMRDRMMAMEELRSRGGGRLNLADPLMRAAFDRVTTARRSMNLRPGLGSNATLPEADRKKIREEVMKSNFEHMEPDDIRALGYMARTPEEMEIRTRALDKLKALDPNNQVDEATVDQTRAALAGLPARLKEFDDALNKNNPEMALRTIYRGLGQVAENAPTTGPGSLTRAQQLEQTEDDIARYVRDVQQGIASTRGLSPELQSRVANRMSNLTTPDFGRDYLARQLVHGARTREDMDRILSNMSDESQRALLDGAQLDYRDITGTVQNIDDDQRQSLAEKHFYTEAFTRMNAAGVNVYDHAAAQQYAVVNEAKIKEGYKSKKISNATLQNQPLMEMFDSLDSIDEDDVKALTDDDRKREFYGRSKRTFIGGLKAAGGLFNPAAAGLTRAQRDQASGNLKHLRMAVTAQRGGNYDLPGGGSVSSLVDSFGGGVTAAQQTELNDAYAQFIRTNGQRLTRMRFNALPANFQQPVLENINIRDLTAIHDRNTQSVIDIIRGMRTLYNSPGMGPADPRYQRLDTIFDPANGRLKNNDTLNGY